MANVALGPYQVEIAEEFGPRITGLTRDKGPNLFAKLSGSVTIDRDNGPPYRFRGGHRLWVSPELPSMTYAPDDHTCIVENDGDAIRVRAAADEAGLAKVMVLSLEGDTIRVDHEVTAARMPISAWGITQMKLGGTAILTQSDIDTAPLPNRSIVLWPYTDVGDRRLSIADDHITVEASGQTPVKLGVGPGPSRLGYQCEGWLFEKWADSDTGEVPDLGAASQVYVGQGFCELETVGTLRPPSEPALLTERWRLTPCADLATAVGRLGGAR